MEYPFFLLYNILFVNPHSASACGKGIDKLIRTPFYTPFFDKKTVLDKKGRNVKSAGKPIK